MLEQVAATVAILIITPGWAVAIIAMAYWLGGEWGVFIDIVIVRMATPIKYKISERLIT